MASRSSAYTCYTYTARPYTYTYTYTRSIAAALAFLAAISYTDAATLPKWKKALDSPFGKDLQRCRNDWLAISQQENPDEVAHCMRVLLLAVVPGMSNPEGMPALGTPRTDPLTFDAVSIGGPSSSSALSQGFTGDLRHAVIQGISDGINPQTTTGSYDPTKKEFTLTIRYEQPVEFSADYKIELNPAALLGQNRVTGTTTSGRVSGKADETVAVQVVSMAKAKNGELRVRSSRSDFAIGHVTLNFRGDNPTDPLTGLLNTVMSSQDAAQGVLQDLVAPINNVLARSLGALYHRGWKVLDQL